MISKNDQNVDSYTPSFLNISFSLLDTHFNAPVEHSSLTFF